MTVVPEETVEPKIEAGADCETYVLSVGDLATTSPTQVIVDTGATESACGIRSMDRRLGGASVPFRGVLGGPSVLQVWRRPVAAGCFEDKVLDLCSWSS